MVRTNTIVLPGMGTAVVRVKGTDRALAMSVDCNSRFVYLDPRAGARLAVAEAARNVACAGALPIGATNCLNFGNPERPEIMWQFAEAVAGMGEACRALDVPITGGNVSLYNETDGQAVLPTPVVGVVGIIEHAERVVRRTFQQAGDAVVVVGESWGELGGSEYLKVVHGQVRGRPPRLDLERERALQRFLVESAAAGLLRSAHDCSEGGLAVAIAESCFDSGLGVQVDLAPVTGVDDTRFVEIATLFGESASRVVVSTSAPDALLAVASKLGVPAQRVGVVGGSTITLAVRGQVVMTESLAAAEATWSSAIETIIQPPRAV
jgi:phosphoribosylformylglycinamidine synthase